MKLLTDWGFSRESWKGARGEYWVVAQFLLILGFAVLPVYHPAGWFPLATPVFYGVWAIALLLALPATVLVGKAFLDLGQSLTPLPHPRDDAQLVQTGAYTWVRHPLYSGLIFTALAWAVSQVSVTHGLGAIALFLFFNAKASREETWLCTKYTDYPDYRQRVKKLIPWLY